MRNTFGSKRAFTLIELLTVIAIIGVLVALLFPAIKSALTKAEATKAQAAIADLSTAFQHYYTEYGKWPVSDTQSNNTYLVDTNLVALLQGLNNTASLTALTSLTFPPAAPGGATTSKLNGNPRGIHFLDIKQADFSPTLGFTDPWKQPYFCRFDVTYANQCADPFTATSPGLSANNVNSGVLIWSAGPDGQFNAGGDTPTPSPLNKDNIKNW